MQLLHRHHFLAMSGFIQCVPTSSEAENDILEIHSQSLASSYNTPLIFEEKKQERHKKTNIITKGKVVLVVTQYTTMLTCDDPVRFSRGGVGGGGGGPLHKAKYYSFMTVMC